jgi:hypothetical protein
LAASKKAAPARKAAKKQPQKKTPGSERPLPPPVPVQSAAPQSNPSDPFNLGPILGSSHQSEAAFEPSSPISSASEPKPGEALPPDAERLVSDVPETIGDQGRPAARLADPQDATAAAAVGAISPEFLQGLIGFEERDVRNVLEEGFDFLADRFNSEHWKLTEKQSQMLGGPTAQLLSSVWTKLSYLLPDQIARWCVSTPGLAGFVIVSSVVIGPKVMQQLTISRQKKSAPAPQRPATGPVPVSFRSPVAPVGEINANPLDVIETDHSFE